MRPNKCFQEESRPQISDENEMTATASRGFGLSKLFKVARERAAARCAATRSKAPVP
jgi:hypothetical protein